MENRNSHPHTETRKGPDPGGKFSPDRTPLHSRQSSRENYIEQIVPPCGHKQHPHTGTTYVDSDLTYQPPTNS
ncbi:hypothetical protein TNCV_4492581 [Trichonephila clavipes]|nr:hypothetical protein TNCV_4492581 [Trichonephila clavipes]